MHGSPPTNIINRFIMVKQYRHRVGFRIRLMFALVRHINHIGFTLVINIVVIMENIELFWFVAGTLALGWRS